MIVMPANNTGAVVGWLAGRFPERVGHLYSIGSFRGPYEFLPYALDNGRYPCWANGYKWDERQYIGLLDRVAQCGQAPKWALVPDVVADAEATLREWDAWAVRVQQYGWPLAFAAQDGHTPDDVPSEAEVVFVGGTTDWKRRTIHQWCEAFPRVHVGRINTGKWLWECHRAGAESCDGTGWLRGDKVQLAGLVSYLERSADGLGEPQGQLFCRPEVAP